LVYEIMVEISETDAEYSIIKGFQAFFAWIYVSIVKR
jgi:hypothetical protein